MGANVKILEDNSLRALDDGYCVNLRLNWYRSLPLTSVQELIVNLDGQPVPSDNITFELNGKSFKLPELKEQLEEFWFVQDSAVVHIHEAGKVKAGETHTIYTEITLRFPYIQIGPDKFLANVSRCSETQTAK